MEELVASKLVRTLGRSNKGEPPLRAALRRGLFAALAEPASRGSGNRALARLLVVPAACAACEELKTFAAGRDLTE